jgi:hypothetical protein
LHRRRKKRAAASQSESPAQDGPRQTLTEKGQVENQIGNILARQRDPAPSATILAPEELRLRQAPLSDCARYDRLRRAG